MKRFLLIFALLFQTLCGNAVADSSYYDYFNSMGVAGRLPGASAQTAFLGFDSTLGTATFVRNGGAVNPDTGLWANENLLLQSETFGTTWSSPSGLSGYQGTGIAAVVTDNYAANPLVGTQTADRVVLSLNGGANATAGINRSGLSQAFTAVIGDTYTTSIYIKANDGADLTALQTDGRLYVGLAAGGTTTLSPAVTIGSGWYRLGNLDIAGTTLGAARIQLWSAPGSAVNTLDLSVYGSQLQRGSTVGPYLATTTAAKYDQPRYVTGKDGTAAHALLVEESSTNLYLNSAALSTQNVTTSATTYTSSFWGTGTITFSGTYTGSLVGTGTADRVQKTFTATAGTLTSTVTGTVTNAQIGALSYATSYIPTFAASATRVAEYATQATSGLITQDTAATVQGWWKPEGVAAGKVQTIWSTYTGAADYTRIAYSGTQLIFTKAKTGQATETIAYTVTITPNTWYHAAVTIAADGTALMYHNGVLVGTNGTTTAFKPVIATNMQYGAFNGTLQINGALDNFRFFNRVLAANEILTYVNKGK